MLPPLAAVSRGQAPKPPAPAKVTPKLSEKAANFKAAVEGGKKCLERDHMDRQKRLDFLEDSVATSPLKRELLEAEFQAREQRGVLAKFRHWSTADFQPIAVLGAGAFGTVYLVRQKEKDQYFALKQMTKVRHGKKNLKRCVYTEREVLAQARNRWFVELSATFQDADHIYMLMEFLPGGDLFRWIEVMRRFSMGETRFYMAELLEALDVLHKHGFIHRDIKFDNMVLTAQGHLKLLDFGLCRADPHGDDLHLHDFGEAKPSPKSMLTKRQEMATQVGTIYYMAPEVLRGEVSPASDIWAVGVMTFECLYGSPPFRVEEKGDEVKKRHIMRQMVLNHKTSLPPRMAKAKKLGFIPADAETFISKVMCEAAVRIPIAQCRAEPFFQGLDFSRLHLMEPPFKPELSGPGDLRNFDEFPFKALPAAEVTAWNEDPSMEWSNYDFDRDAFELQRPEAVKELLQIHEQEAVLGI
mmetsp:Transcript_20246/g.47961  ORF Transcript_20246/g.47961 Transcript_20246/m.47961 type:complete len:469 (+) Transcript_20246:55-1461(+)|eukprot:CAMPEP_0181436808 /NCGR_PEP_ID=MMETSP1110-20121109/21041_1 /TAXON_ID=174948 /ORGANISM="Symbiodinium sp., Strain CCMP421" /LENGTH=468 /DNA_ID=CAMNT_0023560389 /DNA_START=34 /DNA_END=1440 /DNA_ORIENTATION=+